MDKNQLEIFCTLDNPVPYKDLLVYPVCVKDYYEFYWAVDCLLMDKNSVPDINIIKMSNLEYIYYLSINGEPYLYKFLKLLQLVLRLSDDETMNCRFDTENGKPYFWVNERQYNSDDFDNIKEIVAYQNLIELIDETISKEIRDRMADARRYKAEMDNDKPSTLEDQIVCLAISTNYKIDDIKDMTLRKFSKFLQRIDYKMHYQIYQTAATSGMVEFKGSSKLQHWMSNLDKDDKFSDIKMDSEELNKKINMKE